MATTAAARPQVTIYDINGSATKKRLPMPDVMLAPIRTDIVTSVHTSMAKNNRQPYAVKVGWGPKGIVAGMQVSAQSWGTGRAVARVPRVKGGGTHRAGQGAFANMCRGGRMFAPTKIFRRWHRKINLNQKRYAVCSAVAASALPSLIMARGHRIQKVDEIPLVIQDDFQNVKKTRDALAILQKLHLGSELRRCKRRYKHAGRGKARNRRWKHRVGPLIIYAWDNGIGHAARNIRGIDFVKVTQLNLLKLAPGGHVGRMCIWTESAFRQLNSIWGTQQHNSKYKSHYQMPRPLMTNSDLNRIINSQEIQSAIRPKKRKTPFERKRNPLRHPDLYAKLNPLFEKQWAQIKEKYPEGTKPKTTRILKPLKKKMRVSTEISKEDKQKLQKYWNIVIGEPIFKTREILQAEREAVLTLRLQQEREKKGLDYIQ